MPCLCELYPGICLTTEEKAQKNLSRGSQRMPAGTMKTEYTEQSIHNIRIHKHNNNAVQDVYASLIILQGLPSWNVILQNNKNYCSQSLVNL